MPPLTTIRPTVPEPEITAGGLADPLGDLAAPTHLKIEQYLPGDVLGGAHPAPPPVLGDRLRPGQLGAHRRGPGDHPHRRRRHPPGRARNPPP